MGMSANQARFLSLTSRQVDLEYRMQQICHRRLRLASEIEKIATKYNNTLSDRKLFASDKTMYEKISVNNLGDMGYQVLDTRNGNIVSSTTRAVQSLLTSEMTVSTPAEITSRTDANIVATVNGTAGLDFVTHMSSVRQSDGTYQMQETTSIAVSSTSALETLNQAMASGLGLNTNVILTQDMDMNNYDWQIIDNYTGVFDGNCYEISEINIDTDTNNDGTDDRLNAIGMFGTLSGEVKNLNVDDIDITVDGGVNRVTNVGAIAGTINGTGKVLNVNVANLNIDLDSTYNGGGDGCSNGDCSTDGIGGIAGIVNAGGIVDISTVAGTIDLSDSHGIDRAGAFIGANSSTATISQSSATVDIILNDSASNSPNAGASSYYVDCTNMFMGCDAANGLTIDNCYSNGSIKRENGTYYAPSGNTNPGMGHNLNTVMINSWALNGSTPRYWNGTTSNSLWANSSTTMGAGFATQTAPNGNNTWNPGTPPTLNIAGINTIEYSTLIMPDSEELEAGLRDGTYCLLKEADEFTQEPINIIGTEYEKVDWRIVPTIDDDLYKANDAEAESEYDAAIEKINAQDKKLQMEQSNVEVEHKAIITQKDAVKNILNKNIESSFKTFS